MDKITLKDWYSAYLHMILPQTSASEFDYIRRAERASLQAYTLKDFMTSARADLEELRARAKQKSHSGWQAVIYAAAIGSFGLLREAVTYYRTVDGQQDVDEAEELINVFGKFITANWTVVRQIAERELNEEILRRLDDWRRFVLECTIDNRDQSHRTFWDVDKRQEVSYDYSGDDNYEEFLTFIESNTRVHVCWYYFDYVPELCTRNEIKRLLSLGSVEFDMAQHAKHVELIDQQLIALLRTDDKLLDDDVKKYYPKDHFWWYYGVPHAIHLLDRPH